MYDYNKPQKGFHYMTFSTQCKNHLNHIENQGLIQKCDRQSGISKWRIGDSLPSDLVQNGDDSNDKHDDDDKHFAKFCLNMQHPYQGLPYHVKHDDDENSDDDDDGDVIQVQCGLALSRNRREFSMRLMLKSCRSSIMIIIMIMLMGTLHCSLVWVVPITHYHT